MSSELVAILEKESAAEIARLQAEAKAQAEKVEAEGRAAAQAYVESQRQRLEAERKAANAKAQSAAQVQGAALILRAKDEAVTEVFSRAQQALGQLQQDRPRYTAVLGGLIKEAAAGLTGHVVVEVNPDDREMATRVVRELGLDAEVRTAGGVRGGARVATPDARFVVENTLASRIERVRLALASEVAQLLWG
ncbi:MAG TPA: V-type ATP synthase subunit E [bacterium]